MRRLTIAGREITDATPAYVIAELGHNHGGSFQTARQLIQMASAAGADAVKLQKRDNGSLYAPSILDAPYENEHSYGKTYGAHRAALELGWGDYVACRAVSSAYRVHFFATAFDETSADFLLRLGVPAIKLASGALCDEPLIRHVASAGCPIILSTGGGTIEDVDRAVNWLTAGSSPFALLHCTAAYPVRRDEELNLLAIVAMKARYPETIIGWSGHDPGINLALVAYAYGARIIEKHVTLNRAMKGTDHAFSLEPKALATLCEDLKRAHIASGDGVKRMYESERAPLSKMRREPTAFGMRITGKLYDAH